ncbi:MAG: sulfite exporter TauE/SafE family protein [Deinococcales bacterium]
MTGVLGLPLDAFAVAAVAAVLIGLAKAGFGAGSGVIATPLVALTMPVPAAAALLLPVLIAGDIFAVWHYRRSASLRDLRRLLPGALVGIALGALAFDRLAPHGRALEVGVGVLALAFVAWQLFRERVLRLLASSPPSRGWGSVLGAVAGFTSTLAHVGGPPVAVYLLPRGLGRELYVGTAAWFFFIVNLVKLLPYAWLGLLNTDNVLVAVTLLPLAFVGAALGVWLNRAVRERAFTLAIYALLVLTGVQLVSGTSLVAALARLHL